MDETGFDLAHADLGDQVTQAFGCKNHRIIIKLPQVFARLFLQSVLQLARANAPRDAMPGNADVVRQELEREKGIPLTLRTVEREVRPLRRELEVEARATICFETPPGRQWQIDFGERRMTY